MEERKERKKKNRKEEKGMKNRMCRDVGARAGTGLTVVAIALALCVFAQSALAAQISVVPECQIVTKGDYFTVDIYADPEGNETVAGSYNLYFNNTLLNATYQVNGTFLSQDGAPTGVVANETNNTLGVVSYGEYRQVSYGVTNPGVLATITFEAIADGFCELGLGDWEAATTELIDVNLTPIPTEVNNGSVRIGLCGDVDDNDAVNFFDYITLQAYVLGAPGWAIENSWAADVNCAGGINFFDYITLQAYVLGAPGWELNCCCSE